MIFTIEEFAIYDGPGIRTAVFLKGCPLRCIWCHNPEGIFEKPELIIKSALCSDCGRCKEICAHELCAACGNCEDECPKHIRSICGREMTADELSAKLRKNTDFYNSSGGGVTISGGEPFYQSDFLLNLLSWLKDIHTAIETSGYTSADIFGKALVYADLIIMDIKHADSTVHRKITGIDNKLILKNLEILKDSETPFIIRMPLIPGVNDSDENLRETAELLAGSKNLMQVEFLPYNKLTGAKYKSLGREYNPPFDESREPNINQDYFTESGIRSIVL